jgi:indolepyruvate decarboxylase
MIDADGVHIRHHRYDGVPIAKLVQALCDRLPPGGRTPPRFDGRIHAADASSGPAASGAPAEGVIRVADVIAALQSLDQSRYSFVTDVGDSWFIGLELRADVFVAAGYYSSMGFAVPAALGAGLADPARRPLAIVGDGAFQMTGTELATHVDLGLRSIVLLLNNEGYGMLEAIDRPRRYYERRNWDYPALARSLGARAETVRTAADLRAALARAESAPGAYLIEAYTARDDLSPVMARIRAHVHSAFRIQAGL